MGLNGKNWDYQDGLIVTYLQIFLRLFFKLTIKNQFLPSFSNSNYT